MRTSLGISLLTGHAVHRLACSRISYKWKHAGSPLYKAYFTWCEVLLVTQFVALSISLFLYKLGGIPGYEWTIVCLSIHLLLNKRCFQILTIMRRAALNILSKTLWTRLDFSW